MKYKTSRDTDPSFELGQFLFHLLEPLEFGNLHPRVLPLTLIECRLADTVLPANILHLYALFILRQDGHNLNLCEL